MALTLAEINRVSLRYAFLPWLKRTLKDYGIPAADDWSPTDDELSRIAKRIADSLAEE